MTEKRTRPLWTFEEYADFLRHRNELVREWACDRLGELHRREAADLFRSLPDDRSSPLGRRARHFLEEEKKAQAQRGQRPAIKVEGADFETLLDYLVVPESKGVHEVIEHLAGHEEYLDALVSLLDEEDDNELFQERVMDTLCLAGEKMLSRVPAMLSGDNPDEVFAALYLLGRIPCRESAVIIIAHFDRLWEEHREILLDAMYCIASRDFIPLLKRELRPGEYPAEETYCLLCAIHRVGDPALAEIRLSLEARNRRMERIEKALEVEENPAELLEGPIHLKLKCTGCGKNYTYEVNQVLLNPLADTDSSSGDEEAVHILDPICCKNCTVVDRYELTPSAMGVLTAHLDLMSRFHDRKIPLPDNNPVRWGAASIDGRQMGISESIEHYREIVRQRPRDAEARIALGNMLFKIKKLSEAEEEFRAAAGINPSAVEAYLGLAQVSTRRNDPEEACDWLEKCAANLDRAVYYRTPDPAVFAPEVHRQLADLRRALGRPAAAREPGRNDPCPCGSGRKYKKCCLQARACPAQATAASEEEEALAGEISRKETARPDRSLWEKLDRYTEQRLAGEPGRRARARFFAGEEDPDAREAEIAFADWFLFDYLPPGAKTRVIDDFQRERADRLSGSEAQYLAAQKDAVVSLYETVKTGAGDSVVLRDIFSGRETEVHDIRASRGLAPWDLVAIRILPAGEKNYLAGVAQVFPYHQKDDLKRYILAEYEKYKRKNPAADWTGFLRRARLLLNSYQPREKEVVTIEGDRVAPCEAVFKVSDFAEVAGRLAGAPDFLETDRDNHHGGLSEVQFSWEGKLSPAKNRPAAENTLVFSNAVLPAGVSDTGKAVESLASVAVNRERLTLSAISRRRFAKARARLEKILGPEITFLEHALQPPVRIRPGPGEGDPEAAAEAESDLDPAHRRLLEEKFLADHFIRWLDDPLPALDGLTPRQAARDPSKRGELEDLLRGIENAAARRQVTGRAGFDPKRLRRELGL